MQITQFHIDHFKPTYLYIKQHSVTGKLYFGKTTRNVEKYTGSGIHWGRHISLHGKDKVVTLWYCLFTDIQTLYDTAVKMSEIMDIVESEDFLNFKPETGLDGGSSVGFSGFAGKKHTAAHIEKLREQGRTRQVTENMRKSFLKRNVSGANNGMAATIHIFDSTGAVRFVCNGNFEKTCVAAGLPFGPLKISYLKDGKALFTSKSTGRLKDLSMLQYKGWFAKIIS
jgi:hypothetical protein